MSAAAQPRRRPAQSEGRPNHAGYSPLPHGITAQLARLTHKNDRTELLLILRIMDDANQRQLDATVSGWTGVETSDELATHIGVTARAINEALAYLTRPDVGVLEQKTINQAIRAKLLRPVKRGEEEGRIGPTLDGAPTNRVGNIFRVRLEHWPDLPSAAEVDQLDREKAAAEQGDLELSADAAAPVIQLHDSPLIISRNSSPKPLLLTPELRQRLGHCADLRVGGAPAAPVTLSIKIDGESLHCWVSDAPVLLQTPSNEPEKKISSTHSNGDSAVILAEGLAARLARDAVVLLPDTRLDIVMTLGEVTPEQMERYVAEVIAALPRAKNRAKLALRIAKDFRANLDEEALRGVSTQPQKPDALSKPKKESDLNRQYRERMERRTPRPTN